MELISRGKQRLKKLASHLSWFGNRNLEKEAIAISLKMDEPGEKGVTKPTTATHLSPEELELTEKDRTPG